MVLVGMCEFDLRHNSYFVGDIATRRPPDTLGRMQSSIIACCSRERVAEFFWTRFFEGDAECDAANRRGSEKGLVVQKAIAAL